MNNPFESIDGRLQKIEAYLAKLDDKFSDLDRYECGVQVACEELGVKPQTVYQNIDTIPCRKIHGKLYFSRAELQSYIRNQGQKK